MYLTKIALILYVFTILVAGCDQQSREPAAPALAETSADRSTQRGNSFVGSKTCRDCHDEFYRLWATSWHGLAMQPYSADFAKTHLTGQAQNVKIGDRQYRAEIDDHGGWVRELGPDGEKRYAIAHVMGGKNVYYCLTPLDRGRLQVLPIAYDVHQQRWYDTAASGVRHFPDMQDEALDWTDRLYTFNTTCFNCHVSQLATNYDLKTDAYRTTWSEPGITCESCHGPAQEHVRVMESAAEGHQVKDTKIIRTVDFTSQQMNDMCATCHAKMTPISVDFRPGDEYFDHFDLVTLEHADYYPDGRDLGENYTFTTWLMSPCLKSGELACNHCHTPSGRMRFDGQTSNQACLPCHAKEVQNSSEHSHHPAGSTGDVCVACHMPTTRFAAMNRSDHSMRPPTPAATLAFESPNACNLCHTDQDSDWANTWVRQWYGDDYQTEIVRRGQLVDDARKQRWKRLPEMLTDLARNDNDPVYRASLVRLLRGCPDERKWPAILNAIKDSSPLVRSSAVSHLGERLNEEALEALLAATRDPSRLVRIRTAMALAPVPAEMLKEDRDRQSLKRAEEEFKTAMTARPDDWSSHANLGNFIMQRGDFPTALRQFETAYKLEPRSVGPSVNAAIACSNMNRAADAERWLRRAQAAEPDNAAVNFNLGLLLGEQGRLDEAEVALRAALKADPQMAAAAYNLGVMLAKKDLDEAIDWCGKAYGLRPEDTRYAHTLAFFRRQQGDREGAIQVLRPITQRQPLDADSYLLLGEIYEESGNWAAAEELYRRALNSRDLPAALRYHWTEKLQALTRRQAQPGPP